MPLSFGRKLPINHSCVKVFSYTRSIAGPQFRSALNVSCNYLQVLGSPTCPCKFLKTLVIYTEKRAGVGGSTPSLATIFQSS